MNYAKLKTNEGSFYGRKIDALVDALRGATLTTGRGYKLRQNRLGVVLDITPGISGGSACPFQISAAAIPDSDNVKVTISPGTVNNLLPTNYADDFTISDSGLFYVTLEVVSDGTKVTSCSLAVEADDPSGQTPTPFALPSIVTVTLGVIVDGNAYKTIGCGSVVLIGKEEFRVDKSPAAEPGELPYVPYYVWQTTLA